MTCPSCHKAMTAATAAAVDDQAYAVINTRHDDVTVVVCRKCYAKIEDAAQYGQAYHSVGGWFELSASEEN